MQISIGQIYRASFKIDSSIIERFAEFSGDQNPIHLDAQKAKTYGYPRQVAHGAILSAFLSQMIGTQIPGPGAVWMSQSVEWLKPVFVDDTITFIIKVKNVSIAASIVELDITVTNAKGEKVMQGQAKVKIAKQLTEKSVDRNKTQRVALVTGGARGIGAAIARRLALSGMVVAVNYCSSHQQAQTVVESISAAKGSAQAFAADLSDPAATTNMVDNIIDDFGRLDVIVHGASPAIRSANVVELNYSDFDKYLKVYLGGALSLASRATAKMKENGFGRFIFMGTSAIMDVPPVGWAAYLAAKESLWGLAKSMSVELGPSGITTNMVSPSLTVTDLTADIPIRVKEVEARRSPMRRLASVQDTAELVAFLASESAGYINGANLPLTGGPL